MILKVGSNDANSNGEVTRFGQWFNRYAASYAPPVDGYYGYAERDAVKILQSRLKIAVTGEFDDITAARVGYKWGVTSTNPGGVTPKPPAHRPIWAYSAPGSGAPGNVGPAYDLGERCKAVLHINHQWLGYPIGGYLGFMGGDPTFSYNDVVGFEGVELERQIAACPDLNDPHLELWFFAYSQSAEGMMVAVNRLFGDGGKYQRLRSRINGLILFGNPATPGTGIARRTFPDWLNRLTRNINYDNDFYAVAPDVIRPAMYAIIVQAEMELPFFIHVMKIALRVMAPLVSIFGGILGPLGPLAVAGITGLTALTPLLGGLMGTAATQADEKVDDDLVEMLSATGLITRIPDIIALVAALPGLQAHGGYAFDPVMMDRAYDVVAGFRR